MDIRTLQKTELRSASSATKEKPLELNVLAKEVVAKALEAKDKKGKPIKKDQVNFQTEIEPVTVNIDSQALTSIMSELLMNALKFTVDGTVCLTIKQDKEADSIKIAVRLMKAVNKTGPANDVGLGLATVSEILRIYGGRFELKANEPKGLVAAVTLPRTPPKSQGLELEPRTKVPLPQTRQRGTTSWLGPSNQIGSSVQRVVEEWDRIPNLINPAGIAGRTASSLPSLKEIGRFPGGLRAGAVFDEEENLIMSVDDDFVNQEVMRSILEPCGFKVVSCMNGSECLEYFDGDNPRPRLVLLDTWSNFASGDSCREAHDDVVTS
eukprot:g14026.t1